MRHFVGYGADGTPLSYESYSPGGWASICENCNGGCDGLADTSCSNPSVVSLRNKRAEKNPEIVGFIVYDCPCPTTEFGCNVGHTSDWANLHYINPDAKQWIEKPGVQVYLDGEEIVENGVVIDRSPGATATLKIVGPEVPNGSKLVIGTSGPVDIIDGPDIFDVEVNDGQSEEITFIAPAQGIRVAVGITGKWTPSKSFYLRGWGV